nr:hypothetical protein [Rathayibacter rathayi]
MISTPFETREPAGGFVLATVPAGRSDGTAVASVRTVKPTERRRAAAAAGLCPVTWGTAS